MLGNGAKRLRNHHTIVPNYLNCETGDCALIEYDHSSESLRTVDASKMTYKYVSGSKKPLLLHTPTYVFLWVPESYWEEQLKGKQQLALVISKVATYIEQLATTRVCAAMD